eukprot:36131-Alexandrium_andersonii.AAC.1
MEERGKEGGRRNRVTANLFTRVGKSNRMTSRCHLPQALASRHCSCQPPNPQPWADDPKRGRWGGSGEE